jgi:hypothetical protein
MAKKKKPKVPKPRNSTFVAMRQHTKPGVHTDQKKEQRRSQCRGKKNDTEA